MCLLDLSFDKLCISLVVILYRVIYNRDGRHFPSPANRWLLPSRVPRGTKLSPLEIEGENIVAQRIRASPKSGESVAANQSYNARLSSCFGHFRKSRNRTRKEGERYVTECVSTNARAHGTTCRGWNIAKVDLISRSYSAKYAACRKDFDIIPRNWKIKSRRSGIQ